MRYFYWLIIGYGIVFLILGLSEIFVSKPAKYPPATCETRTFDYILFLKSVENNEKETLQKITELQKRKDDPLRQEKINYFKAKLESLRKLKPLVEKQIFLYGSTYSCFDEGYKLFVYDLDYPTFAGFIRSEEINKLWEKLKKEHEVTFLKVLEIVLHPLVILIVGILQVFKK